METEGPITTVDMLVVSVREQPPALSETPTESYTQAVVPAGLAAVTVTMLDSTIWQPRKLAVLVAVAMAAEDHPEILWLLRLEQLVMEVAVAVLFVKPIKPVVLAAAALCFSARSRKEGTEMAVIGNSICTIGGTPAATLDQFQYSGSWEWKDDAQTVLALTSSGNLSFPGSITLQVFLVGGGGGGSGSNTSYGGGGGGGGYTQTSQVSLSGGEEYPVVIGAGGPGGGQRANGQVGGATQAFGLTASGGVGGEYYYSSTQGGGGNVGSGGGANGAANTYRDSKDEFRGGVGGSDGSNGGMNNPNGGYTVYGGSGQGTTTRAFGESDGELYAGGGGGGGGYTSTDGLVIVGYPGAGGAGGGGSGGGTNGREYDDPQNPVAGTANTGGGGGGGGRGSGVSTSGAAGGSGVVLLRIHA